MDFPENEYRSRAARAGALMEELGMDAVLVSGDSTAAHNYRYFSGHTPRNFQATSGRPHLLLLTREGGAAACVNVFSEATARLGWVPEIHTYAQPFGHRDALALFERLGVTRGRVGLEAGLDQRVMMPLLELERLEEALPGCAWIDAAPLIWRIRMVKSPAELERLRRAHDINGRALARTFAEAERGMSERQLYDLCSRSLIDAGSNEPPFAQMTISSSVRHRGRGVITPFAGPIEEPLQTGDTVFLDTGAICDGYWGEFGRMAVMGEPTDDQRRDHDLARTLVRRSIEEALRPAITAEQAMRIALEAFAEEGFGNGKLTPYDRFPYFHIGHGLGLQSSEPPLVRLTDDTPLEAGMVLSVEVYVKTPEMQYGSEETVVLTEHGCELLSDPDRGLVTIA
ncbi:MAG: Xaa-Pro peptidase family protein [Solirubrobacteraceae bacterium]|nr:Xaa-Pro peptidase family protein [Solirubrobacteraceae bacterium]